MLTKIIQKKFSNDFLNFSYLMQALLVDYQITNNVFHFYATLDQLTKVYQPHCRILDYPFLLALFCGKRTKLNEESKVPVHQMLLTSSAEITDQLRFNSYESPRKLIELMTRERNFVCPHKYLIVDLPDKILQLNMMDPRGKSALSFLLRLIRIFQNGSNSINWLASSRSKQQEIFNEISIFLKEAIKLDTGPDAPWIEFHFDSGIFGNHILIKKEFVSLRMGVSQSIERRVQLPMILDKFRGQDSEANYNLWGLRDLVDLLLQDLRFQVLDA